MCSMPTSRGRRRCTSLCLSAARPCAHRIVATRSLSARSGPLQLPCLAVLVPSGPRLPSYYSSHSLRDSYRNIMLTAVKQALPGRPFPSRIGRAEHRSVRRDDVRRAATHDHPLTEGLRVSDRCGPAAHEVRRSPEPSVPVCAQNPDSSILRRPNSPPDTMCATMAASASSPSRTRKACRIRRCSC